MEEGTILYLCTVAPLLYLYLYLQDSESWTNTKAKWGFAAGVCHSLLTGGTVSHVGIFHPAL
jgi:hypothetical protein